MSATRTARQVSKTFLPKSLKEAIKVHCNKNGVNLVVFSDDSRKVNTMDTAASGGTWNGYYIFDLVGGVQLVRLWQTVGMGKDNIELSVSPGTALVVLSNFCGQECKPTVYLRNQDLVKFFGVTDCPEADELPAEVAADLLDEKAESLKPRDAKRYRQASDALREFYGVGDWAN